MIITEDLSVRSLPDSVSTGDICTVISSWPGGETAILKAKEVDDSVAKRLRAESYSVKCAPIIEQESRQPVIHNAIVRASCAPDKLSYNLVQQLSFE